jgi:hypothetical protein
MKHFIFLSVMVSLAVVSCGSFSISKDQLKMATDAADTAVHTRAASYKPADSYKIPEDFIGISPGALFKVAENSGYAKLDDLGVTWVRRAIDWITVEPRRGEWDFSYFDQYVNRAKAAGKKVLFILAFDNPYDGTERRNITADQLPDFLKYVETVVSRYKGRVDAWETWNEPNWDVFWKGTPEDFYALVKATGKKIREIDPKATIVESAFWRTPETFIRNMFKAGALENADVISFHPYEATPARTLELYDALAVILQENNFKGEVWATEEGYPTGGYYPTMAVDDPALPNNFSSYIIKSIAGLASHGIDKIFWYEMMDQYNQGEAPSKLDSEAFFGLIYPNLTNKKGTYAFKLCSKYLPGTEFVRTLPARKEVPSSVTSLYFKGAGRSVLILWNESSNILKDETVNVKLDVPNASPIKYDIYSDQRSALSGTISVGRTPIFITWDGDGTATLSKVQ